MAIQKKDEKNDQKKPRYEMDDGPLTNKQIAIIRKMSPKIPESNFTRRLF